MKLKFIHLCFAVGLLHLHASCQSSKVPKTESKPKLVGNITVVFVEDGDNKFSAGITISEGEIALKDTLYAWDGKTLVELVVSEIAYKDAKVNSVGKTDADYNAHIVFTAFSNGMKLHEGFQLSHKSAGIPGGKPMIATTNPTENDSNGSVQLDGKAWPFEVAYQGALWYAKGLSYVGCEERYLQLNFDAKNTPDKRQLLFTICGFNGDLGVIPNANYTATLSGRATGEPNEEGDLVSDKSTTKKKSDFVIEVTEFKQISDTKAIISLKFSGTLDKGLMIDYKRVFKNGEINNVEVTVFNEKH